MTEQRRTALRGIERVTGFLRKGAQTAASMGRIAAVGRRLRLPAPALFAKHGHGLLAGVPSLKRGPRAASGAQVDGGRDHANMAPLIQRFAATAKAMRATARATDRVRNKATSKLPLAMEALARSERSVGSGKLAQAMVEAPRRSTLAPIENSRLSRRVTADLEAGRAMPTGTRAIIAARAASVIHGVVPPPNLSQRMFAEPSSGGRDRNNRSGGAGITIHSSPTVVINGPNSGGDVQRELLGALRAHREELFDQLRRESARRERAQF